MGTLQQQTQFELHLNVPEDGASASVLTDDHAADDSLLPFALTSEGEMPHDRVTPFTTAEHVLSPSILSTSSTPIKALTETEAASCCLDASCNSCGSSTQQPPPTLTSSAVSTPTTTYTTDGENSFGSSEGEQRRPFTSASLIQANSQELDTAASLLLPNSSLMWNSLSIASDSQETTTTRASGACSDDQIAFRASSSPNPQVTLRLPALPEEDSSPVPRDTAVLQLPEKLPSRDSIRTPPRLVPRLGTLHHGLTRSPPEDGENSSFLQQTIVAAASQSYTSTLPWGERRRMASLAGATARKTSPTSFQVSVDLSSSSSGPQQQNAVMEILGNPDLLPLWCDSVPGTLVITSSSEGARSNMVHPSSPDNRNHRQYEGEWIEATTNRLVAPAHATSCWYYTARAVKSALGFPVYGKIVMFVERQRGQVSVSIGPFPGGVTVSHQIKVEAVSEHRVRLSDQVQLRRANDDDNDDGSFCGTWGVLSAMLFPSLEDYMDQVLSSMARLRFLIENGDCGYVAPTTHLNDGDTLSTPLLNAIPPV